MSSYSLLSIEDLVHRCTVAGDAEAWEEFVRRFHRLIAAVILRAASRMGPISRQTIDDLIQETYLRFCADDCRILRTFEHRHPEAFTGFIKVVAANVVRDHLRSALSEKRDPARIADTPEDFVLTARDDDPGSAQMIEKNLLIDEVNRYLLPCIAGPDQDRNNRVFWLYYRTGLSASAIASLPGIGLTTKGVESLILRMTRELRERMMHSHHAGHGKSTGTSKGILPAESL